MVGRFAERVTRARCRKTALHQFVVEQVCPAGAAQRRQPGLVPHQLPDRDVRFAVGAKLRPVLGNRDVVVNQAAVDEAVDDSGRHALGRGEHHGGRIRRPGHPTAPIRVAGPHVDDRFPVEVDRQCPAAESAAVERAGEAAHRAGKMGIGCAVNTARQHRPAIAHHFEGHTVECTVTSCRELGIHPSVIDASSKIC